MRQALEQWQIEDGAAGWIPATAPGDTHAALIAAGRLADPYTGRNETAASGIADREWRWRSRFNAAPAASGERVELVFDGLDTYADIHLNGTHLGRADNMFRAWRFDVGALLRADGANELVVVFHPTARIVEGRDAPSWGAQWDRLTATKRGLMRKAQFGWGWDWGPVLPTVGIWGAVQLERGRGCRLDDVRSSVATLSDARCELRVDVAATQATSGLTAAIALRDPDGVIVADTTIALDRTAQATLAIPQPRLWWTADLGAQPLYCLQVRLMQGGEVIDTREMKIGLRTLTLDQSPDADEPGTTFFRFVLNGVPIFSRGACWIPASSFVGIVDAAHYRKLLEQAVDANMNMIRVWGGGVYEHDVFYDLCDELGLLVWQDFMFACAPYPEDDASFVESVREEVRYQAKRLRHHASLALWCGNNECQVLRFVADRLGGKEEPLLGTLYYDRVIPEILETVDPVTPYWPGSPWGGPSPNSMRGGDVHDWTVWHGMPPVFDKEFEGLPGITPEKVHYTRYAEDLGRFISEFGIHAAPSRASLARWLNPEDLKLDAPGFLDRIKDNPKHKVYAMLEPVTGLPRNLDEYIDFTMMLQAEGLKFGVEHFRRRKPHCSGTLIWQFNDCWPCVSWSLVDYDGDGKASLYAMKRAYAPVLASFKPLDGDAIELWITNDTLRPVEGQAVVDCLDLSGAIQWSANVRYAVDANASRPVWRGTVARNAANRMLHVRATDGGFDSNRWLPAPIKDLQLVPGAKPNVTITAQGPQALDVELSADAVLLLVSIESPHAGVRYSDNYFDLLPGERRTVRVSHTQPITAADLTIRCWNESR